MSKPFNWVEQSRDMNWSDLQGQPTDVVAVLTVGCLQRIAKSLETLAWLAQCRNVVDTIYEIGRYYKRLNRRNARTDRRKKGRKI